MPNSQTVKPLEIGIKLHNAAQATLKYSKTVRSAGTRDVMLADPRATRVLVALMDHQAVNGGAASHWGGPAALAEAMSATHALMFESADWTKKFNFINDVGHAENGIYAIRANYGYGNLSIEDLKGFRSIESKLTGHGECHLYPEGVLLSNGPLGSSVGQAQGLAMADKLSGSDRVTINVVSDGASMEGEAKEAFAAIPGLALKGLINPFVLMISDNNTKLSGRIDADSFSMNPSLSTMQALGWHVIEVAQGNDLQACYTAIEAALNTVTASTPICLRLKTIKGFGVKATEQHAGGGHGFPIKAYSEDIHAFINEIWGSEDLPREFSAWATSLTIKNDDIAPKAVKLSEGAKFEKMQAGFARSAIAAAKKGLPVVSVSADLQGSTGMAPFHKEFPAQAFDVGVAEANMVSVGAGFAKQGFIPIVDTFAAFGVTKGNLPLIMSSLSSAPVICVFSHTGFQDAADGASHQSLTYFSAVSSIPNTDVVCVSSSEEAEKLMTITIDAYKASVDRGETPNSTVFFVGRENFPSFSKEALNYQWNKAQIIKEGSDVTIVATGPMLYKAIYASELLASQGVSATVINNAFINNIDTETISKSLATTQNKLITIEDHQLVGGMGAQLVHALKLSGVEFMTSTLAVKSKFGQSAYTADQLYAVHGISADDIVRAYKSL
jgi:transketolase